VVNETLQELEITAPILHVFNKIDTLSEKELEAAEKVCATYKPYIMVHTMSKAGIAPLVDYLKTHKF